MRLAAVLVLLSVGVLLARSSADAACSPQNYTHITNSGPLPVDFCAFTYLPFRVKIPENPQHIDTQYTPILQTQYLPKSGLGFDGVTADAGINVMYTMGVDPRNKPHDVGNGAHPVYIASPTDPLVHVNCNASNYGCSNLDGGSYQSGTVLHVRIPAHARPTYRWGGTYGDPFMTVIQPDGSYFEAFACGIGDQDWPDGFTMSNTTCFTDVNYGGAGGTVGSFGGASLGHIVTSAGNNNGSINAGDGQIALPAKFQQVMNNNIENALHVYAGCFKPGPGRYPGTYAGECNDGGGVPVGSHIWLDLTRAQIDALSASDPTIIPPHMRVFAYALHEHGAFMLDTGNGFKWITQFTLEDGLPCFTSGACTTKSYWQDWFYANGGGGPTADGNLKINTPIDWSRLTTHVHVLQECYVRGTCSDSIPEGAVGLPAPTNLRLISVIP